MKRYSLATLSLALMLNVSAGAPTDYVWDTPSTDSSASMPVGGGDIGLNVWAEDNGDILFYMGRSGAYDEHGTLLKQGRVRLRLLGGNTSGFSQRLKLEEGYCTIDANGSKVTIWADVFRPVVHVEVESSKAISPAVSYENWRYADRPFKKGEGRQNSWKWSSPKGLITSRDSVFASGNAVTFLHANPDETVFDVTVAREGLDSVKNRLWNPLANLTSGGRLRGDNMRFVGTSDGVYDGTDYRAWNFESVKPARKHHFTISFNNQQTKDLSQWIADVDSVERSVNLRNDRKASREWWRGYWDRSYIASPDVNDSIVGRIARNYTLFRYMLGCNAYGKEPTKFNGGLFTFDPHHVKEDQVFTPDYRNWGGGTMTAQNQRLVYWPMLKSGDFDMMTPQFDFYNRMLDNACLRSQVYWGHDGACFAEQIELFGLPNMMEYGTKRPAWADPGVEYNAWLEYEWDTVLEFCQMMLESARYNGTDISQYRPLIEKSLTFFDEHYRYLASRRGSKNLDGDGKLILFPGSGCETYKMTNNASSTISALRRVTGEYIDYMKAHGDTAVSKWTSLLGRIPEMPLRTVDGRTMIAPAKTWERINNVETPQLYPVWPWKFYGVTVSDSADLQVARNTYLYDPDALRFRSSTGWKQDNIWAARLGLVDEAFDLTSQKFADGSHRFPSFFGPGYDWTPDHNWGGSAMIGLQEMLMQTGADGKKIYILPSWPLDRDISFKLHAPEKTEVEVKLQDGKIVYLNVTPSSRIDDIVLPDSLKKK
ncbi:DUF5703 domain-containing protein [uncultured Duncaniella sp.]|uniref:DUF5703 domain-containing protein n=1 Tax=uncultured Duncaniella sp. TaxID=2768039 RepID=UPI002676209D|nr:DUF5703 domain-containing protein [uncultured Duncaniella sp.]MCI9171622.1 hypothetical protein [Muribaculaceae bacterium]